ncbi:prepilin peptidase [Patescibacteria group bacterium]|nr:prepilin peptidase [Patescibacteria group bacterium]
MSILIILTIVFVVVGMFAGSFVNILVFRTNEKKGLLEKSTCLSCKEKIALLDVIPVLSFIRLRGRCRKCSSAIHWQYPVVEMMTGILFGLFFARTWLGIGIPDFVSFQELILVFLRDIILSVFLLVIFIYDFKYEVILDRYSLPAILIAILFNVALGCNAVSMILGALLIGGFFAFQFLVSKGRWIGGGDIRLGVLMGFLLGVEVGLVALFLSYIIGSFVGIWLIFTKRRKLESYVPFGTFLSASTIICMLFGVYFWDWYISFF